jgi:hypothetical protein
MACRGCSQVGDCACAVVGDGTIITVTGTGGILDPFTINFSMTNAVSSVTTATPVTGESWTVVGRRSDGIVRRIPLGGGAAGCCAQML